MDFKDSIKQLADKIAQLKDGILTEEATKNAFIMPFINALGYDVFNPLEVIPEMDCDLVKKKGEKIDYAIMKEGSPIILIECKHWKQDLSLHDTQLKKYFVASKAKFGLLTNGIRYLFYTDLEDQNIMDEKPFLEVDITDLKDYQFAELKKFHKSYFDIDSILSSASELKYSSELKKIFAEEIVAPSPEIVKFFTKKVYEGIITSKIQEQFSELVKRAIGSYINELISKRLKTALSSEEQREASETITANVDTEQTDAVSDKDDGIETTQEELEGFNIVKAIVRKEVDISRVVYRDALSYFAILLDDNNRKPICRLYFNSKTKKYISTFDKDKNETKHEITDLNDIFYLEKELCEVIKTYNKK
ncbi:restriction endonuclease [Prevotella intermedia]|uniref:type I restriction endonuclease n=1 Tax=Prevotella intermedia TaxID=28131 RepID=UPI000C1C3386|nr:type I restriction endonuclease [Prevotella intermedia]ATV32546.1 restriction endonuclease [Prevotella intermedia]ATV41043.1 restriction endonuclease [Prevotella intermedia]MCK6143366.1 type I restriction enzyme HsdR N-terminal domain-containing protein [Prevotella intermedia]